MKRIIVSIILALTPATTSAFEIERDGKLIDVPVCGGFVGLVCRSNQWCDYPTEGACGIGDHFGVCRDRPEICTKEYMPVCGCDGITYGNACEAAAAGHDVAHAGACMSVKE